MNGSAAYGAGKKYTDEHGGGGGDVTKVYVDEQDNAIKTNLQNEVNRAKGKENELENETNNNKRYLHTLTRFNNDAKECALGWFGIITKSSKKMTYTEFAKWLYDNSYTTKENVYDILHGGCVGTTTVSTPSGTTNVGVVMSGAFSSDGNTISFKANFNGYYSVNENRIKIDVLQL